jgi:hypothetical protein
VFTDRGFQAQPQTKILSGVLADLQAAFGGNLNPALETPQGQIASTETAIIWDTQMAFSLLTQNVDPAYASGRMQDGIGRIYFMQRYPARPTTVQATCTGLQGVHIPAGVLAKAIDGNYYTATGAGTIDASGTVVIPFQCNTSGPIACPTGALNQVYQVIPGWDSITNLQDGVIGQDVESRAAFELRRFNSVAGNSAGMLASVQGAVLVIPDVLDAYTTENFSPADMLVDGVTLKAHSLYVCVAGGDANAVAQAIFTRKAPGCAMSGNSTVIVYDSNVGYSPPYPSYAITYQIANPQTFIMNVTIVNSTHVPSTAPTLIKNAILAAWAGDDGGSRARIGSTVFASRYYAAVATLGTWVQLVSIKLGSTGAPIAQFTGSIPNASNVLTVAVATVPGIAVGQTIVGPGIKDGTRIASLGTGTGGIGTYNLSAAVSAAVPVGTAMTSIAANLDDIAVGIAHIPVLSAANVTVTLASAP